MSRAVLVTGSAGMVGSHLVEHLRAAGESVIATYLRPTIPADEVDRLQPLVELDVRDATGIAALIAEHRPARIFHLAAQSYPTVSWDLPLETIDINVGGTINLYEAIKAIRKSEPSYDPLVVNACSSAAYGATLRPENVPIREDALLQPLHPYGVSKAAQDMLTYQYFVNDGIRGVRARIFNSTGPRKTNDVVSDFCSRSADIVMADGPLRVGNLETQRAILDVADLVQALLLLSDRGRPAEAYNICADRACRVGDMSASLRVSPAASSRLSPIRRCFDRPTNRSFSAIPPNSNKRPAGGRRSPWRKQLSACSCMSCAAGRALPSAAAVTCSRGICDVS